MREGGLAISPLSDVWEGGLAILPLLLLRCGRRGRPPPSSPLLRLKGGLPAVRSLALLRRLDLQTSVGRGCVRALQGVLEWTPGNCAWGT